MIYVKCKKCGKMRKIRSTDFPETYEKKNPICKDCYIKLRKIHNKKSIGAKTKQKSGYINVKMPINHPLVRNGNQWIPQHWLNWWQANGATKKLAQLKGQGFSIHHKNGKRNDNRLYNLELMLPGRHPVGWKFSDIINIIKMINEANPENEIIQDIKKIFK